MLLLLINAILIQTIRTDDIIMFIKAILTNTVLFYDARGHGALLYDQRLSSALSQDEPQVFNNGNYGAILCFQADLLCLINMQLCISDFKRLTMATMALFSVSKQTYCALLKCNSASVTLALRSMFFNIPWKGVLTLLQCCLAVTWLVAAKTASVPAHIRWTPYTHAPVYSVALFKATYTGCMCV